MQKPKIARSTADDASAAAATTPSSVMSLGGFKPVAAAALAFVALALAGCGGSSAYRSGGDVSSIVGGEVRMVDITPELLVAENADRSAAPAELLDYRPEAYRIAPGDTIRVTVWDHPELAVAGEQSPEVPEGRLVLPDGTFYYPFVGTLKVEGMRLDELRSAITSKLARYLRDPQVDVNVAGFGSQVALQGAFNDTSPQDVTTVPLTLMQAVGAAGVDVERAFVSGLVLTRDGEQHRIDLEALNELGEAAPQIYLKPGDRLYLPFNDDKEAYVLGEVLQPQAITFNSLDMTLTQVLGRAGGLNPITAKREAVYVIRGIDQMDEKPATVYQLNAESPAAFALADRFEVKPGDVVYVGAAGVTRWNRFLSQLLPLSGIIRNASMVPSGN